jgi:hypothetical protein
MADELPIEDRLAVEHDIVPFDWADVFQQAEIDSIGERVARTQDPRDFARLPVDDARQIRLRQRKAFTCSHSSRALMSP